MFEFAIRHTGIDSKKLLGVMVDDRCSRCDVPACFVHFPAVCLSTIKPEGASGAIFRFGRSIGFALQVKTACLVSVANLDPSVIAHRNALPTLETIAHGAKSCGCDPGACGRRGASGRVARRHACALAGSLAGERIGDSAALRDAKSNGYRKAIKQRAWCATWLGDALRELDTSCGLWFSGLASTRTSQEVAEHFRETARFE